MGVQATPLEPVLELMMRAGSFLLQGGELVVPAPRSAAVAALFLAPEHAAAGPRGFQGGERLPPEDPEAARPME
jgi:hypothetical protein